MFKRQVIVQRSELKCEITASKGGRSRRIPLTTRLTQALKDLRHLRGPRVLYQENGQGVTQKVVRNLVLKAARRANLTNGGVHILRHTFCSHLAMKGTPARAIQELEGSQHETSHLYDEYIRGNVTVPALPGRGHFQRVVISWRRLFLLHN